MFNDRRGPLRLSTLVASALLVLAGCEPTDPEPIPDPVPTLEVPQLASAPFFVPVGQSITLTAYVKGEDGTPLTQYELRWNGIWSTDGKQMKVEPGHPSPGVETVTLTPQIPGRFDVSAFVQAGTQSAHTRYAPIIAWGGTTRALLPFQQALGLVVGEERPAAIFPAAQPNDFAPTLRVLGNAAVVFSIDNPAIASVSAAGLVRGLTPGATRLQFKTGSVSGSVPVTVAAGSLGPPPVGIAMADGLPPNVARGEDGAFLLADQHTHEQHLAVDSQGNPMAVLHAWPHYAAPLAPPSAQGMVLVSRWTGSGLGTEWVSEPWDDAIEARLAFDEQDVPYVAYYSRTFRDLVVASRPKNGGPESWTRRRLPMDLAMARSAGLFAEQYVREGDPVRSGDDDRLAILPREGGGVFIAFRTINDFRYQDGEIFNVPNLETPGTCAEAIKLAEVTGDAVTLTDLRVGWYDVAVTPKASCRNTYPEQMPLHLLPPAPGERLPRVLSTYNQVLELFEPRAGAWVSSELGHSALQPNGFYGPTFVAVARPDNAKDPVVLLSYDERTSSPLPEGVSWNALPGRTPLPYLAYGSDDSTRLSRYFGYLAEGRLYSGSAYAGPISVQTAYDGFFREEPSGAWKPGPYDRVWGDDFPLVGEAHLGRWLHLLSQSSTGVPSLLTRTLPAADPLPTAPETTGLRLGTGPATPLASSPPLILPDGSRYVLTDIRGSVNGELLRSSGPGQPWTVQRTRAPGDPLATAQRLWFSGSELFFLRTSGGVLELHRSSDLGKTFSLANSVTVSAPLESSMVHPAGPVYAMLLDPFSALNFKVAFAATPTAALSVSDGLTGADFGTIIVQGGVFFPTPTGALLAIQCLLNDGTGSAQRLFLRAYDLTGAIVSQRLVDPQLSQGYYLSPRSCGVSQDSSALLCVNQTDARRVVLSSGAVTAAPLPTKNEQEAPPPPITLSDGRFLLPFVLAQVPHSQRAGYRLSGDGVSWGDFHALRPQGGDGQSVMGVAAESDGGALFVLGDSGLMMAGDGQTTPQAVLQRLAAP